MMGKQKAAVLPDPVCAHAIRSRPATPMGMEYRWTGVGLVYLHRATLAMRAGPEVKKERGGVGFFYLFSRARFLSLSLSPSLPLSLSSHLGRCP